MKETIIIMNRELLQMSELILSANRFFQTSDEYDCVNLTDIRSLVFDFESAGTQNRTVADGTAAWERELIARGAKKLFLFVQPSVSDLQTLALANGVEKMGMVSVYETHSSMWLRNWKFDDESKQWDIGYREYSNPTGRMFEIDNDKYYMRVSFLKETLLEIKTIAETFGLSEWAERFDRGYRLIDGATLPPAAELPLKEFLRDEACAQIIDALTWSWVFGGQGSWTDEALARAKELDKEEAYRKLTYALYQNCLYSLMYCINL